MLKSGPLLFATLVARLMISGIALAVPESLVEPGPVQGDTQTHRPSLPRTGCQRVMS